VIHRASPQFWELYNRLPTKAKTLADQAFELLKRNVRHPSLHFKKAGHLWSVRVGLHLRALAIEDGNDLIWFWIGSHAEYDRLL
jgi:hypothetical protein